MNAHRLILCSSKRFVGRKAPTYKSWPNDWVPFHWSRPEQIPGFFRGGDLVDHTITEKDTLKNSAKHSVKLAELDPDDPLRRIYTVNSGTSSDLFEHNVNSIMKKLGIIHEVDLKNSREAKIIRLTFKIRQHVDLIKRKGLEHEQSKEIRTICNALVNRRYRNLCELKEIHSERHTNLLKALQINPPDNPINIPYVRPFRKTQMRHLTKEYCKNLRKQKIEEYIKSLEGEKEKFEKEKAETMKWIQEQEKFLGITV